MYKLNIVPNQFPCMLYPSLWSHCPALSIELNTNCISIALKIDRHCCALSFCLWGIHCKTVKIRISTSW